MGRVKDAKWKYVFSNSLLSSKTIPVGCTYSYIVITKATTKKTLQNNIHKNIKKYHRKARETEGTNKNKKQNKIADTALRYQQLL